MITLAVIRVFGDPAAMMMVVLVGTAVRSVAMCTSIKNGGVMVGQREASLTPEEVMSARKQTTSTVGQMYRYYQWYFMHLQRNVTQRVA